jgi:hypothetical protein
MSPALVTDTARDVLMQMSTGYIVSSALNAIARLRLADCLAGGPLSVEELAGKVNVCSDALTRVLRLLVSVGVFDRTNDDKYSLNKISNLLCDDVPGSMLDTVAFISDPFHFQAYVDMIPVLQDGKSAAEHVWGKNVFDAFADDPATQARFDDAMTNMTASACVAVLEAYDFSGIQTLVDVAGGHGALLSAILQKNPTMRGILFDLPRVIDGAGAKLEAAAVSSRCQLESGDFFQSVPGGDAIIMKHIIHDWDDERALAILRNCHRALPSGGKLLLVEMLLSDQPGPHFSKVLDVEMLMLPGGRERTEQQYRELLNAGGFELKRVIATSSIYVVLESLRK